MDSYSGEQLLNQCLMYLSINFNCLFFFKTNPYDIIYNPNRELIEAVKPAILKQDISMYWQSAITNPLAKAW